MASSALSLCKDWECIRCGTPANLPDSNPTGGRNCKSREHKCCGSIRRSMDNRCKVHPGLKHWFKTAPASEKKDWYLRQKEKGIGKNGIKREWDDHELAHLCEKGSKSSKAEQVQWEDWEMYSDRRYMKAFGYNDGNHKKAMAMLEDEWKKSLFLNNVKRSVVFSYCRECRGHR